MTGTCDTHVHLWTPDAERFPTHPSHALPESLSEGGTPDVLLAAMDRAGVTTTLVVQPINYMFDHSYILSACRSAPAGRLRAIALANITGSAEEASSELTRLVRDEGCVGVRLNTTLASDCADKGQAAIDATMRTAGELDVPVAMFAKSMDGVKDLIVAYPNTKIVIDHFAFCKPGSGEEQLSQLLEVGRTCSNAHVKASAFFRVSNEKYPYKDLHATVVALVEAFGAHRVLLGTDFPFVTEHCSYEDAVRLLDDVPLSDADRAWVRGGAAAKLYKLPM